MVKTLNVGDEVIYIHKSQYGRRGTIINNIKEGQSRMFIIKWHDDNSESIENMRRLEKLTLYDDLKIIRKQLTMVFAI